MVAFSPGPSYGLELSLPYPILLVVGGLALSLLPGPPTLELPPDLVLMIFLPLLLYSAGLFLFAARPQGQLQANSVPFSRTCAAYHRTVAVVGHAVIGLPWPVAYVRGNCFADPVAVSATTERFGLPRRVATILEGESLINDGTALVLYPTAVATAAAGGSRCWRQG